MTIYVYQHKVTKLLTLSETTCAGELWELIDEYDVPDPGEGGGEGGTTNYNQLTNKPQVNGVTLSGNKTSLELKIKVGDVDTLTTTSKDTAVAAINELDGDIGNRSDLVTSAKSTVVAAINELNEKLGNLNGLTTAAKNTLVNAINEHDTEIGDIDELTTTDKANLVVAIKELDREIGNLNSLTTSSRSTVVAAINQIDDKVGKRANLTTSAKSTVIAAINELDELKAPLDNVLTKDNETIYTPSLSYHPATKNYVDTKTTEASSTDSVTYQMKFVEQNDQAYLSRKVDGEDEQLLAIPEYVTQKDAVAALANAGAKNLLPNNGSATSTSSGITWTKNADGSVTANGTATGTSVFYCAQNVTMPKGKYKITGSPEGASDAKYFVQLHKQGAVTHRDTGNSVYPQVWEETSDYTYDWFGCAVLAGVTADNLTFYPMVRDAAIKDDTYVPYAKDNVALTEVSEVVAADRNISGRADGERKSYNGVTFTLNDDKSITINGTAANHTYYYMNGNFLFRKGVTYRISSGLTPNNTSGASVQIIANGAAVADTLPTGVARYTPTADTRGMVALVIRSGQTASNLTAYPMMQDERIAKGEYVQPVMSNSEMADVLNDTGWQTSSVTDAAHQIYCRKKNGFVSLIAQGAVNKALNANQNQTIGTLPTGFRPNATYVTPCVFRQAASPFTMEIGYVSINANGTLAVVTSSAKTANTWTLLWETVFPV